MAPAQHYMLYNLCALIWQVLKSHGQDYLVGNRLTRVDIHLLEVLLYVEELDPSLLAPLPLPNVRSHQRGSCTHMALRI